MQSILFAEHWTCTPWISLLTAWNVFSTDFFSPFCSVSSSLASAFCFFISGRRSECGLSVLCISKVIVCAKDCFCCWFFWFFVYFFIIIQRWRTLICKHISIWVDAFVFFSTFSSGCFCSCWMWTNCEKRTKMTCDVWFFFHIVSVRA